MYLKTTAIITGVNNNNMNTRKYILAAEFSFSMPARIRTRVNGWFSSCHQLRLFCVKSISSWDSSVRPSEMNFFKVRGNSKCSIWSLWFKCLKITARQRSWMDENSRFVTPRAISVLAAVLKLLLKFRIFDQPLNK